MSSEYFAKSVLPNGHQPTVKEHLKGVSILARQYGEEVNMAAAAELAGILHDFGKYSALFQKLLCRETSRVNHAACGAIWLWLMCRGNSGFIPVIEGIRGHHYGLISCEGNAEIFKQIIGSEDHIEIDEKQIALAGKAEFEAAFRTFLHDFPEFRLSKAQMLPRPVDEKDLLCFNLKTMLTTRMLSSCLVDADYTVSAADVDGTYPPQSEEPAFSFQESLRSMDRFLDELRQKSGSNSELNHLRTAVFDACGAAGELPPGVFNLTAPTGTGKTLALLHFALRHCVRWGKRRIIVVLPFLSLTEQSSGIYRKIVPQLLEDTSLSDLDDTQRMYSARWRVPFVVTTSVKFFETLFSCKPADFRRLHNIADSVIVFDEAQSLPPELTRVTIKATDEMCDRYGCTMVFSTATQPDYSAINGLQLRKPREILPDHAVYYQKLKRTDVEWRLQAPVAWEQLSSELAQKTSVCAVVNLRKHARTLYRLLTEKCERDEVFFLTTDLCPEHRSQVIAKIRDRLERHFPCRVVSTQCIEAGVDLDFNAVFRALAPLDSIIQAAGRCNRNGKLPENGQVVVFVPEDASYPGDWYRNCAETVKRLSAESVIDIHDPGQISRYYREVFSGLKDKQALQKAVCNKDYAGTAHAYQLIEKRGLQVVVPFTGQMILYNEIAQEARDHGITPQLMKRAAPITVSCFDDKHLNSVAERISYAGKIDTDQESPFYMLRPQYLNCYTDDMGLQIPDEPDIFTLF